MGDIVVLLLELLQPLPPLSSKIQEEIKLQLHFDYFDKSFHISGEKAMTTC